MNQLSYSQIKEYYQTYYLVMKKVYRLVSENYEDWSVHMREGRFCAGKVLMLPLVEQLLGELSVPLKKKYRISFPKEELEDGDLDFAWWEYESGDVLEEFMDDCYSALGWTISSYSPENHFLEWAMENGFEEMAEQGYEADELPDKIKSAYLESIDKGTGVPLAGGPHGMYRGYFHALADMMLFGNWSVYQVKVYQNEKVAAAYSCIAKGNVPERYRELFSTLKADVCCPLHRNMAVDPVENIGDDIACFALSFSCYNDTGEEILSVLYDPYKALAAALLDRLCDLIIQEAEEKRAA